MASKMNTGERIALDTGFVVGTRTDNVRFFLGIPYAAPPVGALRFAEPVAVAMWSAERDATLPGAIAPQRIKPFPGLDVVPLVGRGEARGDDYLTLNVLTPVGAEGRPVMVFIHGGGFV